MRTGIELLVVFKYMIKEEIIIRKAEFSDCLGFIKIRKKLRENVNFLVNFIIVFLINKHV